MPTTTFFNLPTEKRDRFLHAARTEFARAPYSDVSINRIIREASIPRGSFYMYFKDKRELLFFLLGEYTCRLAELMETTLIEQHGDLFAAFLAFYDTVQREYKEPRCDDMFRPLVAILQNNAGLDSHVFESAARPDVLLEHIIPHIDKTRLLLRSETDLKNMFVILTGVTGSVLSNALQSHDPAAVRVQYINYLDILKRGMAAPETSN